MGERLTVRKEVEVGCAQAEAFRLFTEGIGRWWPIATHSLGGDHVVDVRFEARLGGRIFEVLDDGSEEDWGEVLAWDPPASVRVKWGVSRGRPPTTWEAVFTPLGESTTRLVLEHWGWEALGDDADEARTGYHAGWDPVLSAFALEASG